MWKHGVRRGAVLVVDEDVLAGMLSVVDVGSGAGVEVEETNGEAFWIYEPWHWMA
jgi:hypothetical protein